jgi:hypothetical protein
VRQREGEREREKKKEALYTDTWKYIIKATILEIHESWENHGIISGMFKGTQPPW